MNNLYKLLLSLANNDTAKVEWLLDFLAFKIQQPTRKFKVIIVFKGCSGTGKSILGRVLHSVFKGQCNIVNSLETESYFNSHLKDNLICCIEDVGYRKTHKNTIAKLKELSGCTTITLNEKYKKEVSNYPLLSNFIIFTNRNNDIYSNLSSRYRLFESNLIPPQELIENIYNELNNPKEILLYLLNRKLPTHLECI